MTWEEIDYRQELPGQLQRLLGTSIPDVALPTNVFRKISQYHPLDRPFLIRLSEVINDYEYAGISPKDSPKDTQRIELYKRLDDIWFTAVVQSASPNTLVNILVTFHRINKRKLLNRIRRGYLLERG